MPSVKGRWLSGIMLFQLLMRFGRGLLSLAFIVILSSCSMSEEVKRINEAKQAERQQLAATSTNLTGEQIYLRSCAPCHPAGRQGVGPALDELADEFKDDLSLRNFIRKGKGNMPGQPVETINDQEMNNLISYLRTFGK